MDDLTTLPTATTTPSRPSKARAYAQLGKMRVYQHVYELLIATLLLTHEVGDLRPGSVVALVLVLVAMETIQFAACAADDIVGFRNGSDAANLGASKLTALSIAMLPKPLVSGALTEREAVGFAVATSVIGLASGAGVVLVYGFDVPLGVAVGFLLVFACAVQYSSGIKLSYRAGGLELVIFMINVATVLLPYWLVAERVSATALMLALLAGVWFLLIVSYGNAADREGDEQAGRRTFAVLAPRGFRVFLGLLYVATTVLHVLPFVLGSLRPAAVVFVVPALVWAALQCERGVRRGEYRRAYHMGFRSIDLGGVGMALAILCS